MFVCFCIFYFFFFFKQKTAYEMRISDWSSDVCSSDLILSDDDDSLLIYLTFDFNKCIKNLMIALSRRLQTSSIPPSDVKVGMRGRWFSAVCPKAPWKSRRSRHRCKRSEEHTSELQSLMRISYAVFCLNK